MKATTFLSSNHPLLPHKDLILRKCYKPIIPRRRMSVLTSASHGETDDQGQQQQQQKEAAVNEENKIVVKMRIKKPKSPESINSQGSADQDQPPPPSLLELKEWEKKEFVQHEEGVFDLMELLQGSLMKTRPSMAVGVLALLALTVPLSSSVVMVNVLKILKGLLAGCHVCIDINF